MVNRDRTISAQLQNGAIDRNIRIMQDGETCRLLGAWIGNRVQYITPWPSVLDKIACDLERWNDSQPTLEGKRHIINMVIGGRTQYLTRVQGLPKEVENTLIKAEHSFLWGQERARIAHETMTLNIDDGGKQILDITARNEAIDLGISNHT
jgi:hypothetical protein